MHTGRELLLHQVSSRFQPASTPCCSHHLPFLADRPRFDLPDLARTLRAKSSLSFSMLSDMRRSWLAATVGQGLGPSPAALGPQQFGLAPGGSPGGTSPRTAGAPSPGMASPNVTHAGGVWSAASPLPPAVLSSSLAYAEWHEEVTLLFCGRWGVGQDLYAHGTCMWLTPCLCRPGFCQSEPTPLFVPTRCVGCG